MTSIIYNEIRIGLINTDDTNNMSINSSSILIKDITQNTVELTTTAIKWNNGTTSFNTGISSNNGSILNTSSLQPTLLLDVSGNPGSANKYLASNGRNLSWSQLPIIYDTSNILIFNTPTITTAKTFQNRYLSINLNIGGNASILHLPLYS